MTLRALVLRLPRASYMCVSLPRVPIIYPFNKLAILTNKLKYRFYLLSLLSHARSLKGVRVSIKSVLR